MEKECNSGNYPNCNLIRLVAENITSEYSNFVALCRKEPINGTIQDKCEIAKLAVSYNG